jgi:type II secretory pathway pseudopilin PulG
MGLLIVVAVMGMGLAAFGELYSRSAQRDKERELLFVGNEFRQAIAAYYQKSPGTKAYPKTLDELVEDKRFPVPQHHLRRVYRDPMTGSAEWGLVPAPGDAGIMGVHSRSEDAPVKSGNFDRRDAAFQDAPSYKDWVFFYSPST